MTIQQYQDCSNTACAFKLWRSSYRASQREHGIVRRHHIERFKVDGLLYLFLRGLNIHSVSVT